MTFDYPGEVQTRPAEAHDWGALTQLDPVSAGGDAARCANIRRWCEEGSLIIADESRDPLGYGVLEYTFFEQGSSRC
ncbi:hypothetical protein [Streptomyces winkii]|uniref:hypothetical protein n=1 Tax=Streptomyces winkii TaxID=3051178 RepID=UPI0028D6AF74|nr:hypothetical protein [Streptomyces sp. DSM 40971]